MRADINHLVRVIALNLLLYESAVRAAWHAVNCDHFRLLFSDESFIPD